jgi:hypothetical protein
MSVPGSTAISTMIKSKVSALNQSHDIDGNPLTDGGKTAIADQLYQRLPEGLKLSSTVGNGEQFMTDNSGRLLVGVNIHRVNYDFTGTIRYVTTRGPSGSTSQGVPYCNIISTDYFDCNGQSHRGWPGERYELSASQHLGDASEATLKEWLEWNR